MDFLTTVLVAVGMILWPLAVHVGVAVAGFFFGTVAVGSGGKLLRRACFCCFLVLVVPLTQDAPRFNDEDEDAADDNAGNISSFVRFRICFCFVTRADNSECLSELLLTVSERSNSRRLTSSAVLDLNS